MNEPMKDSKESVFNSNVNKSIIESMVTKYQSNVNKAIMDLANVDETEAKKIQKKMDFSHYVDFILAVERDDTDEAFNIVEPYVEKFNESVCAEAIAQEIHYNFKNLAESVLNREFLSLKEHEIRTVLSEMHRNELHKILANLRGFSEPGSYEITMMNEQLQEKIVEYILEGKFMAPGEANRANAYGSSTPDETEQDKEDETQDKEIEQNEKEIEQLKKLAGMK